MKFLLAILLLNSTLLFSNDREIPDYETNEIIYFPGTVWYDNNELYVSFGSNIIIVDSYHYPEYLLNVPLEF